MAKHKSAETKNSIKKGSGEMGKKFLNFFRRLFAFRINMAPQIIDNVQKKIIEYYQYGKKLSSDTLKFIIRFGNTRRKIKQKRVKNNMMPQIRIKMIKRIELLKSRFRDSYKQLKANSNMVNLYTFNFKTRKNNEILQKRKISISKDELKKNTDKQHRRKPSGSKNDLGA